MGEGEGNRLRASPKSDGLCKSEGELPEDVVRLVIAARVVAFERQDEEALRKLDEASEAFASRVPWDDEPDEGDGGRRYFCVRHLPPTSGARCSPHCGVGDGSAHRPDCLFVRDRYLPAENDASSPAEGRAGNPATDEPNA